MVKLCQDTWTADIDILMLDDQKQSLLSLNEKDEVTFKARLKGTTAVITENIQAEDGKIIT